MYKAELERERFELQAVLDNYESGFSHFEEGSKGFLNRDVTEQRIASLKRRIAYLDDKIERATDENTADA